MALPQGGKEGMFEGPAIKKHMALGIVEDWQIARR